MRGGEGQDRRAARVLAICVPGLGLCALGVAAAPTDQLSNPLSILLAICAVIGTRVSFDVEGTLFWDGSFLPIICAAALLGPVPTVAITLLSEFAVWGAERYRPRVLPLNLLGTIAPNLLAAWTLTAAATELRDTSFYAVLAVVIWFAVALNATLITALAGVLYGDPIIERMLRHRRILAPIAVNVVLAIGAVAAYRAEGVAATGFVIGGVFVFAFVANRLAAERDQRLEIEELALSRGRLVAQVLEAEDRERRALADVIHDDLIQLLIVARQDLIEAMEGEADALSAAAARLDEAIAHGRQVIRSTHPSILDQVGLEPAVRAICEQISSRGEIDVALEISPDAVGPHDRLLFSAVRELLGNVVKHARASKAAVSLARNGNSLHLTAIDDGIGFDVETGPDRIIDGHIGLHSLRERVEAIGGQISIRNRRPGTAVSIVLPTRSRTSGSEVPSGPQLTSVSKD